MYEWHQLLLNWVHSNQSGDTKPFIPLPYNWKTYGDMNVEFWKKHQNTSLKEAKEMLEKTHNEVLHLAETFSNEELFSKGIYKWAGSSPLDSYFVSATASHYDWAIKKLKAHSQIGYSQSASLLAHNLIAAIAAFPWESALPRKQGSPNPPLSPWRLRSGGLP